MKPRLKVCVAYTFKDYTAGIQRLMKCSEYVQKYATKDAADEAGEDDESEDEMSSVGSYAEDEDEEPAGNMEEL
jgi:hypothetical protein